MKLAIIDIGSNSIRYMEAEALEGLVLYSPKQVFTTRLAEGLLKTGRLSEAAMARSLTVIADLAERARLAGVPIFAYATSAVRDADNREPFCAAVAALLGKRPDLLSGEQEARYAYLAAAGGAGGFLEIGGGSTQIVRDSFCRSFPLGCVRAKDLCPKDSFVAVCSGLLPSLDRVFSDLPPFSDHWTGAGGTITTLCALCLGLTVYDRGRIQGAVITRESVSSCLTELSNMGDNARSALPLLRKRHDVILHGGAILLYLMERLMIPHLTVSDTDGMEGYALARFKNGKV